MWITVSNFHFYTVTMFVFVSDGGAVRIRELRVPQVAIYGETVLFSCLYELDGPDDILFSVKWYKNQEEFYRYIPGEHGRKLTFPLKGVNVHVSLKKAS